MRVISGTARGRKLDIVLGDSTRPITDRVKSALFNILQHYIEDKTFLDLFAGTGSVGIEAISRGAGKAVFLESNRKAFKVCKSNVSHCGFDSEAEVRQADAFSYIKSTIKSFDFIFVDPPQFKGIALEILKIIAERPEILNPEGQIILKLHPREYEEFSSNLIKETRKTTYGSNVLVFYEHSNLAE